jgi:hypothetical protein
MLKNVGTEDLEAIAAKAEEVVLTTNTSKMIVMERTGGR